VRSKFIKEYFSFSKRERNGLIVLLAVLIIVIISRVIIANQSKGSSNDFESFENEIDVFMSYRTPDLEDGERFNFDPNTATKEDFMKMGLCLRTINSIITFREKGWKFYKPEDFEKVYDITPEEYNAVKDYIVIAQQSYSGGKNFYNKEKSQEGELFKFDPNTATKEELEALGLKSWQADNVIKFRDKGGVFRTEADFAKIYGMDEKIVEKLSPYIEISEEYSSSTQSSAKSNSIILSLNSATETELQQLSGIGPSYAKRIVEYRTRLGGFINVEQLMEVYGMTEELYMQIQDNFTISTEKIKKININTAEYKDLVTHPYINKENAKTILNFKKFAGKIKSFDELLKQKAINQEFYDKISPYITTE